MRALSGALLLSLFTGMPAGLDPATMLDGLAQALRPEAARVAQGLDARVDHLLDGTTPELARESLELLAPLAERLGLDERRARLEDASFRALQPDAWSALAAALPSGERDAQTLDGVLDASWDALSDLQVDGEVTGRVKSLYSTWRKMERKAVTVDAVYDRVAVRVRVDRVEDCYRLLDALHTTLQPVPGELDDYIVSPKPSGYRSLHTAVHVPLADGTTAVAEVQIRTHAMHAAAESGDQAHWRYKQLA
jgi:GTP pyrophosphokinase